jgi:hypothetical protein
VERVEDDIESETLWSEKLPLEPAFTHEYLTAVIVNEQVRILPDDKEEKIEVEGVLTSVRKTDDGS